MMLAVNPAIQRCLDAGGGLATTPQLLAVTGWGAVNWARRSGHIVRVLPGVFASRALIWDDERRIRAALHWAAVAVAPRPSTALATGPSALTLCGLPTPPGQVVHLEVPAGSGLRSRRGVVVHRPVVAGEPDSGRGPARVSAVRAIVTSWSVLHGADRRAPVFAATRGGRVDAAAIREEQARHPRMRQRAEFLILLDLVEDGCESELEFLGRTGPFAGTEFDRIDWQHWVVVRGRRLRVDGYDPKTRTAIELDGDTFHSTREQRRDDALRTRLLAEAGIRVIRFHYDDIVRHPDQCRRQLLTILGRPV